MDPDRWRRIEAVLDVALDLPSVERQAYVEQECADDPDLAAEVLKIIEAGERPDPVLDASAAKLGAPLLPNEIVAGAKPPERVGPYRIQRLIGEGGMGTVYLAHTRRRSVWSAGCPQARPTRPAPGLARCSAIPGRTTDPRDARSPTESLGCLDGGLTEDGLPFFAMEFVEGIPIDRYCDERGLGIDDRLELFVRVCDALAHAHGSRSSIATSSRRTSSSPRTGEPKLLDFGIAKLLGPDQTAASCGRDTAVVSGC